MFRGKVRLGLGLPVALLAVVLGIGWTFAQPNGDAPSQAQGDQTEISIKGSLFQPAVLRVPVGATVRWTNEDPLPHDVTSRDGSWGSGTLDQGQEYAFTFTEEGAYSYLCTLHPWMRGLILTGQADSGALSVEASDGAEWMGQHMDAMHGPDSLDAMQEWMDETFGPGTFDSVPCHQDVESQWAPGMGGGMTAGGMMMGSGPLRGLGTET